MSRKMALVLMTCLVLLALLPGARADEDDDPSIPPPSVRFDGWLALTALVPGHSDSLGNAGGFVIGLALGYADIPIRLGVDFGHVVGLTRARTYALASGELTRVPRDTMSFTTLNAYLRVAPEFGRFRPYIEAVGGTKTLDTQWFGSWLSGDPGEAGSLGYSVWTEHTVDDERVVASYRTPQVSHVFTLGVLFAR